MAFQSNTLVSKALASLGVGLGVRIILLDCSFVLYEEGGSYAFAVFGG